MKSTILVENETLKDRMCNDPGTLDRVCHELRRPIAVISAYAELLADELPGPLNQEQKAHLAIMLRSAERMGRSIEDLFLVFSNLTSETPSQLDSLDLERFCYDLMDELETTFSRRGVKLSLLTRGPLWHPAVDAQRLRVALTRLLECVLAYASEGEEVVLRLRKDADRVRFEIRDPGPCLTKEDLERVFDFLHRPERNRISDRDRGGADLSVCRVLIESMGGRVRAQNRSGEATTYTLELPANWS